MHRWGGPNAFPSVVTVFSAPNYQGTYKNKGAVIMLDGKFNIKQFRETETPYRLPGNLDLFAWSLPFVAQKTIDALNLSIKRILAAEAVKDTEITKIDFHKMLAEQAAKVYSSPKEAALAKRFREMRAKMLAFARF